MKSAAILAVLAHPDDELFCSGLLCKAVESGLVVHLAYLTRGEGGAPADGREWTVAAVAATREREARTAAETIGAASVQFLGYVDPPPATTGEEQPGNSYELFEPEHDPVQLTQRLRALIDELMPVVVITHGSNGEYGHPAHRLLNRALRALLDGDERIGLIGFNAGLSTHRLPMLLNTGDPVDFSVDVRPWASARAQSLRAHRTQRTALLSAWQPFATVEALIDALPVEAYHYFNHGEALSTLTALADAGASGT